MVEKVNLGVGKFRCRKDGEMDSGGGKARVICLLLSWSEAVPEAPFLVYWVGQREIEAS